MLPPPRPGSPRLLLKMGPSAWLFGTHIYPIFDPSRVKNSFRQGGSTPLWEGKRSFGDRFDAHGMGHGMAHGMGQPPFLLMFVSRVGAENKPEWERGVIV